MEWYITGTLYIKTSELAEIPVLFLFSTNWKLVSDINIGIENIENPLNKFSLKFWAQKNIISMTFARIFTFNEMQSLYTSHFKSKTLDIP